MLEGEEEVVRAGSDGVRKVTYLLRFVNGKMVARKVVDAAVRVKAVPTIVAVGTKEVAHLQLRRRQHRLGLPGAVRVRRQLGHQHRQRLLRRPPVQRRHLARLRRHRLPAPGLPRDPDRRRDAAPRRHRRLRLVARLRGQARPAPLTPAGRTPGRVRTRSAIAGTALPGVAATHARMTPPGRPEAPRAGRGACAGGRARPPADQAARARTSSSTPTPCAASCASPASPTTTSSSRSARASAR